MSNDFWNWFIRKLCQEQRITLPNVGTFSIVFSGQKNYTIIRGSSINHVTQKSRVYVRFRPTGQLKASVKDFVQNKPYTQRYYTGDRNPELAVFRWGPFIQKSQDLSNLSQHRRLIWFFHKDSGIRLHTAARIVGENLQNIGDHLSKRGFVKISNDLHIQIVRGKKNARKKTNNPNRWRLRFSIDHKLIIQALSDNNIT